MRLSHCGIVGLCLVFASASISVAQEDPFAAGVRTTEPLTPEQQLSTLHVPAGFRVELVAAEPDIAKPMNMAFDARGRLWVTSSLEYPFAAPADRPGRDTVRILEDTNGDGRCDRSIVFADGLNIPIGLLPVDRGCIVFSIPNIWLLEDTNGDDVCDKRTVLYGPFDTSRDTHGMCNAFRRGWDGWIYACHGFNNNSVVRGKDGHEVRMTSGNTFRFRPDGSRIEHFTIGQVNPFGSTFDEWNTIYTADCHSKPITQLVRLGCYPSFGRPHDGLGFVPDMMSHLHGSTAICGIAYSSNNLWPPEYSGQLVSGNVMTSRLNRNRLEYQGASAIAVELPDFLSSDDPWFRPVDLQFGPDGALYIADFYNRIIGHYEVPLLHPGRDRERGRIWRVVRTDVPLIPVVNLAAAPRDELVAAFDHPNISTRQLALSEFLRREGRNGVDSLRAAWQQPGCSARMRLAAVWGLARLAAMTDAAMTDADWTKALQDSDPCVVAHALHAIGEFKPKTARQYLSRVDCANPMVAAAYASAVGLLPSDNTLLLSLSQQLLKTPAGDGVGLQVQLIAVREQLRGADSTEAWRTAADVLSPEMVLRLLRGTDTASSAEFQLELCRNKSAPVDAETALRLARRLPETNIPALFDVAQNAVRDSQSAVFVIRGLSDGFTQRGVAPPRRMYDWAVETVQQEVLKVGKAGAASWLNWPVADKRSAENPWVRQIRPSSDGDDSAPFLCSLPRGEGLTGRLRSPEFDAPEKLSFYIAGHAGFPDKPLHRENYITIRDARTGEAWLQTSPPRNDTAQRVEWDLSKLQGQRAVIEIVDGDDAGAYAWLAVGRFEPAVISVPDTDPQGPDGRFRDAASLAADLKLETTAGDFAAVVQNSSAGALIRTVALMTVARLKTDSLAAAAALIAAEPVLSEPVREAVLRSALEPDADKRGTFLAESLKMLSSRSQARVAEALSSDLEGSRWLVALAKEGRISPRLLRGSSIAPRLAALKNAELDASIVEALSDLPPEAETLSVLIDTRREGYRSSHPDLSAGKALFTKHCAACHQVAGEGAVVGPQLDGIGLRGLDRLAEDLLAPSRNVDLAFRTTTLILNSGLSRQGLLRREEGAQLVLVDNKGEEFRVNSAEVEERVTSTTSLMPDNVAESLSEAEFYNILGWLLSQRKAAEPETESTTGP